MTRVPFTVHSSWVKPDVAPLEPVTVPCLELTAAVVSVKTSAQLQRELDYEGVGDIFWTDSKVVLSYIANETRRFHIFVGNRPANSRTHFPRSVALCGHQVKSS